MSTPAQAPAVWASASVVQPSAVGSPKSVAVVKLGEVLKHVVQNLPSAFAHENDVLSALNAIDGFVGAFVPGAELPAVLSGEELAKLEDVTKRTPPGGAPVVVSAGPAIDYQALAQAILAEQRRLSAPPVTAPQEDAPA